MNENFPLCDSITQNHRTQIFLGQGSCVTFGPDFQSQLQLGLTTFCINETMYTFKTLLFLCSIPFTLGQYGNPPPGQTSTSTSSASAAASASPAAGVQVVTVGQNGLTFSPNSITAAVGSFVEFHFFPPTHSVAQSSFSTPCAPPSNGTGFWSGLIQSSGGQNVKLFLHCYYHTSLSL
jgi:plastocyanin